ncbi:UPF0489 family protein [Metasolibacillus sp. FSL K6-0083]|uniref:UPF0489 family protein n=1 Tax=Metasolibacillus sp. FSL K6-0083 TaxID=2921416 RepID=UPI00315A32BA
MTFNIIQEHNEAFYKIIEHISFEDEKYVLIHIDEHHDFGTPIIRKDDLMNYRKNLKDITYSQLRVSDYIIPLFHLGKIDTSMWLSNNEKEYYYEFITFEELISNDHIMIGTKSVQPSGNNNKFLEVKPNSNVIPFIKGRKLILSIDLDYFSCCDEAGERTVIEITKQEFERFNSDLYHKSRLNFGSRVSCHTNNDKYYMIHQHMDGKFVNKQRSWEEINTKLAEFDLFLNSNKINPDIVIVCNSLISGYTPSHQHNDILSNVIKIVKKYSTNELLERE